ncbi:hypothetical protein EVAR_28785_1 [Eumeta japonica]|uniref:Uncharacterized protein n=1 Tax=Eumeta variegata TaxID=151549 RepID=A0A4C1VFY6_EUMVA|nr:hypothetical protein EVAR_28785_1 [Eumeta japonica]
MTTSGRLGLSPYWPTHGCGPLPANCDACAASPNAPPVPDAPIAATPAEESEVRVAFTARPTHERRSTCSRFVRSPGYTYIYTHTNGHPPAFLDFNLNLAIFLLLFKCAPGFALVDIA